MSDQENEKQEEEQQEGEQQPKATSYIHVAFADPTSAQFEFELHGVNPTQALAIAGWLRAWAERMLNDAWTQEAVRQARKAQEMAHVGTLIRGDKIQ